MVMLVSEFSYGYAFTENLVRSSANGPLNAPKFPSLIEEGSNGFDVNVDLPGRAFYFQFKVGRLLRRSTAREIANGDIPGLQAPYYRMPITRRDLSRQHQLLIDLEARFPNSVFYAAPMFVTETEFQSSYAEIDVHRNSALFSPAEIGPLPDTLQHNVIYKPGMPDAWFCSSPRKMVYRKFTDLTADLAADFAARPPLRETAAEIKNDLIETLPSSLKSDARRLENQMTNEMIIRLDRRTGEDAAAIDLAVAKKIAKVALGAELVVAQPG